MKGIRETAKSREPAWITVNANDSRRRRKERRTLYESLPSIEHPMFFLLYVVQLDV